MLACILSTGSYCVTNVNMSLVRGWARDCCSGMQTNVSVLTHRSSGEILRVRCCEIIWRNWVCDPLKSVNISESADIYKNGMLRDNVVINRASRCCDNFHQVWSSYVPTIRFRVMTLTRYVTLWPGHLTFWPWTLVINYASRVQTGYQFWTSDVWMNLLQRYLSVLKL